MLKVDRYKLGPENVIGGLSITNTEKVISVLSITNPEEPSQMLVVIEEEGPDGSVFAFLYYGYESGEPPGFYVEKANILEAIPKKTLAGELTLLLYKYEAVFEEVGEGLVTVTLGELVTTYRSSPIIEFRSALEREYLLYTVNAFSDPTG